MHEILSARGVAWLAACLICGFVLLAIHMLMKIRMVVQASPGAWLLAPREDRLTFVKYRDEARDKGWAVWPIYVYQGFAGLMLLTALMVIVNEMLLKTPHYPEAEVQQVFLRWKSGRKAKLAASPAQAIADQNKEEKKASDDKAKKAADEKPATPPGPKTGK